MDTIAFARGVPAPEMLPVEELQQAAARAFAADPVAILSYGTGGGYTPLRQHLAAQHGVEPGQIILTSGSLQGFVLLAEHLAARARAEGRQPRAVVENPTYDRPLILLERAGWTVDQVRLDADGIDPAALDEALNAGPTDFVYLIPSFQNPAGATLSEERRVAVLEASARHGALILEDDPYGQLHFETPAPPSLYGRDASAEVVYSSSFSKTVSPGLRVGYLVLSPERAKDIERRANDTYISPSLLAEGTVLEYLLGGSHAGDLVRVRGQLHDRCRAICAAIEEHLPDASYVAPGGGYFLWLELAGGVDAARLATAAAEHGVTFVAGSSFGPGNDSALRLAFSSPPQDSIAEGIRRVAAALAGVTAGA